MKSIGIKKTEIVKGHKSLILQELVTLKGTKAGLLLFTVIQSILLLQEGTDVSIYVPDYRFTVLCNLRNKHDWTRAFLT